MDSWSTGHCIVLALAALLALARSQQGPATLHRTEAESDGSSAESRAFIFPTRTGPREDRTELEQRPIRRPLDLEAKFTYTNDLSQGPGSGTQREPRGRPGPEETPAPRKPGPPDIHEIINGFVKLLNGNVQLAAGPAGADPHRPPPPGRPLRTRINNRGPPRITDLPPLLLDPPPPSLVPPPPPRDPPPYPFEKPLIEPYVTGIPLPERVVPALESSGLPPPLFSAEIRPHLTPPVKLPVPDEQPDPSPTSVLLEKTSTRPTSQVKPTTTKKRQPGLPKTSVHKTSTIAPTPTSSEPTRTTSSTTVLVTTQTPTTKPTTTSPKTTTTRSSTTTAKTTTTNPTTTTTTTTKRPSTSPTNRTTTPKTTPPHQSPTPPLIDSSIVTPTISSSTTSSSETASTTRTPPLASVPAVTRIESSVVEIVSVKDGNRPTSRWEYTTASTATADINKGSGGYARRPGIVLDDPEYKPGLNKQQHQTPVLHHQQVPNRQHGQVFDVTVSAVQGNPGSPATGHPVVYPVELEGVNLPGAGNGEVSVITSAEAGQHFVSIDGKRTYINLFGSTETSANIAPTSTHRQQVKATAASGGIYGGGRPVVQRRPQQPPVRIDTCIVGDWSTCDSEQHEICRTELGVSSCHCAPGYSRHSHRQPCKRVTSIVASVRLEKFYEQKLVWNDKLGDKESQEYLQMEYEINRAMESAMSMTPFSDAFMGSKLNNIYTVPGSTSKPVIVNLTLQVEESPETLRPQIKSEIQKQLLGAIHRRNNNLGTSPIWAAASSSVSQLQDLDECFSPDLNDCHAAAICHNTFGSFECKCPDGFKDDFVGSPHKSGRRCETCSPEHCNHRGTCSYVNSQPVCQCSGSYYGSQCEIDGEVLGVAIGASVAAVVIILSTLACLCMWSRKWNKEQKVAGMGSPVFSYMPSGGSTVKTPGVGAPPYQVSLEDRLRWAQIADAMAHATNHYAPEPVGGPTRPASALYGYAGTLPIAPVPLPRLGIRPAMSVHNMRQDSSSEEEDKADLLGRNFHVPRPKSRSSIANQSGIYYDVDYDQQQDHYGTAKQHPGCIPLSTYTLGRAHYYRT